MASVLEHGPRGKGGRGSQGACPLAEYEAAPHARLQRATPPTHLPISFTPANSPRIAFCPLTPAPLSPCFHPHSAGGLCRHRCLLVFSIQGVLPSLCRPEGTQSPGSPRSAATSQSPQLGAFAYSAEIQSLVQTLMLLWLYPWLPVLPYGCIADRTLPPSPTTDAATPPAYALPPQPLSSGALCCLSSHHFAASPYPSPLNRCPAPHRAGCSALPVPTAAAAVHLPPC